MRYLVPGTLPGVFEVRSELGGRYYFGGEQSVITAPKPLVASAAQLSSWAS